MALTLQGRRKLVPGPAGDDPYEDEAYLLWQIEQQGKS